MAVQFVRTKEHRLKFEKIGELLFDALKKRGISDEEIQDDFKIDSDSDRDKIVGIQSILDAKEFVPYFLNKVWVLLETSEKNPFYISDNPITLHNEKKHGLYGNIGLAVKGIEIYLPLSSTHCLALFCPSLMEEFTKARDNLKMLDNLPPELAGIVSGIPDETRNFLEDLFSGRSVRAIPDNVTMLNSLQVMYSSRFVYCKHGSFELVQQMIKENESFRTSLQPRVC